MQTVKSQSRKMFGKPVSQAITTKPAKFVSASNPNPGSPKALFKPKKPK